MQSQHMEWIKTNVPTPSDAYGQCKKWSALMIAEFPELRLVRGFYDCPFWGERTHWWCVDANGHIVDATAHQFPSRGIGEYRELKEGERAPTNRCANCSGPVYDGGTVCGSECHKQYVAYLMAPVTA